MQTTGPQTCHRVGPQRFPFLLLFLTAVSPALAVDTLQVSSPDRVLEPWRWTVFNRSNGLAGQVYDVFEDRDGNIWFATDRGAQRYDGIRWVTYTKEDGLAHNDVRTMIQTQDGAMWFGTYGRGISRFDGTSWTTYTAGDGLASDRIWWRGLVQAQDGSLWAAGDREDANGGQEASGVSRFDGATWTMVEVPGGPSLDVNSIFEASDGTLWFPTWGEGALRFNGVEWTRFTTGEGLAGDVVLQMLEGSDGALWFACGRDGISRFKEKRWKTYAARSGLPEGSTIGALWMTDDGTVWAGSGDGRISRFDGDRWRTYSSRDLPQLGTRLHGQSTRDGVFWVWERSRDSVFRLDYASSKWQVFDLEDPLFGGAETADGCIWFGTRRGAVCYDGAHWLRYTATDGLLDAPIYRMQKTDDGSLWFFAAAFRTFFGVSRYENGAWLQYSSEAIGLDSARRVFRAADGSFWVIGSSGGSSAASRYDGQAWRVYTREDGLVGARLSHICQTENGALWFGTGSERRMGGSGVLRFDGERWTVFTTEDGLAHNHIYGLFQSPDGALWVGTRAGLSWFDGSAWHSYTYEGGLAGEGPGGFTVGYEDLWFHYTRSSSSGVTRYDGAAWRTYTTRDGLVDNRVRDIYRASDGALWFATEGGVSRFDGASWISYTEENGLPDNTVRRIWQSADGRMWFETRDGKAAGFTIDNVGPETTIASASRETSSGGNILLRWSGRDLWEGTPPEDLRYQWRRDGGAWSPVTDRTDWTFTGLSSGQHRFEVRAVDHDLNVDPTPAVHAFAVEAPWWKHPWVLGLVVVFVGVTGFQASRLVASNRKLKEVNAALSQANKGLFEANVQIQEANRLKSQFLANMSHEVRTPMNAIIGFTRLVLRRGADRLSKQHQDNLVKVMLSAEHLLNLINDVLDLSKIEAGRLEVKPEPFDVKRTVVNACATVGPMVKDDVTMDCEVADGIGEAHTDESRLQQILINLLSNAVKFTDAGQVVVRASQDGAPDGSASLVISVSDTGTGIPADQLEAIFEEFRQVDGSITRKHHGTGLGLAITKRLAELLGGTIHVESEVGRGSTFTVKVPVVYGGEGGRIR